MTGSAVKFKFWRGKRWQASSISPATSTCSTATPAYLQWDTHISARTLFIAGVSSLDRCVEAMPEGSEVAVRRSDDRCLARSAPHAISSRSRVRPQEKARLDQLPFQAGIRFIKMQRTTQLLVKRFCCSVAAINQDGCRRSGQSAFCSWSWLPIFPFAEPDIWTDGKDWSRVGIILQEGSL